MSRFDWSRVVFQGDWTQETAAAFARRVEEIAAEEDAKRVPTPEAS